MSFSDDQKEQLGQLLNKDYISSRQQGGMSVSYLEAHHTIREANRIFGFDGWGRETIYNKEVCRVERRVGSQKEDGWKVGYEAKVKITVDGVAREGTGHGSGIAVDLFDAIEGASKEAETDAMKRALMTFGDQFGLALYDKKKAHVDTEPLQQKQSKKPQFTPETVIKESIRHAGQGTAAYQKYFNGLCKEAKKYLIGDPQHETNKATSALIDSSKKQSNPFDEVQAA